MTLPCHPVILSSETVSQESRPDGAARAGLQPHARCEHLREHADAFPLIMPLRLVTPGILLLEAVARINKVKPVASMVQIKFITNGWIPSPEKAIKELGWRPMTLGEGIKRYLSAKGMLDESGPTPPPRVK